jgi:hypothetical protein
MFISNEQYELLVQYTEWLRSQSDDELEMWHSERVVAEFLETIEY